MGGEMSCINTIVSRRQVGHITFARTLVGRPEDRLFGIVRFVFPLRQVVSRVDLYVRFNLRPKQLIVDAVVYTDKMRVSLRLAAPDV